MTTDSADPLVGSNKGMGKDGNKSAEQQVAEAVGFSYVCAAEGETWTETAVYPLYRHSVHLQERLAEMEALTKRQNEIIVSDGNRMLAAERELAELRPIVERLLALSGVRLDSAYAITNTAEIVRLAVEWRDNQKAGKPKHAANCPCFDCQSNALAEE